MSLKLNQRVPKRIASVMKCRGLSQNRFAPVLGVSQGTLSKWLKGDVQLTLTAVDIIAEALEVPVEELLRDDTEEVC